MIGCGNMGMGSNHNARLPVEKMPHALLLACSLSMKVDHDGVGPGLERTRGELPFEGGERVVERIHEDPAHRIDGQYAGAVFRLDQCGATARRTLRIVDGSDEPWRALDEDHRFSLIPGVVAERDRVGTSLDHFLIDGFGNAKTTGGVLAIDHHEIKPPLLDEFG
jgi:hypothetical protein